MPRARPALPVLLAVVLAVVPGTGASSTPAPAPAPPPGAPATMPAIDLERYMGAWHVIAHIPYFAERGHVASQGIYTLKPGGDIAVRYVYRTGFGQPQQQFDSRATVRPDTGNREWTTWFFRMIPTKYRILEVAPDYSWALIDYPGRDLAWVFARTPTIDHALYADLLVRLRGHGVDVDKLRRVPQLPEQVGELGFADPKES